MATIKFLSCRQRTERIIIFTKKVGYATILIGGRKNGTYIKIAA